MTETLSPAVFIDRDGTIMEDTDYCSDPKDVRIFPGVIDALHLLKSRGFKVVIITNQSGIGRGLFTMDQYRAVESELLRQLGDGLIDATYYCPHAPGQDSEYRKPAAGMVFQAARDHQIDLSSSFLIGDKEIDVECAHNAGLHAIRVRTGDRLNIMTSKADWLADDVPTAVQIILAAGKS
jgi:D-glycero-D-manno-heptose 1,7-bisphosphate phosphatase